MRRLLISSLLMNHVVFAQPAAPVAAPATAPSTTKLEYVVYMSRHGVRTPLQKPAALNDLSVQPWPAWKVPVADLTAHGRQLMQLKGTYDREYLSQQGLITAPACADANRFYFWADNVQRDIESARAMASGIFPDCDVPIHAVPGTAKDPMFLPLADVPGADQPLAAAARAGRFGGNERALLEVFQKDVVTVQRLLHGCNPAASRCATTGRGPKTAFPAAAVAGKADTQVDQFQSLIEDFALEYLDGMDRKDIGWGHLTDTRLRELLTTREEILNLLWRTPYIARTRASGLLSHLLRSMEQAVKGEAVAGALGTPGDKVLAVMGHDSDLAYIGEMMDIHWLSAGYAPDATPPDSSITFEIRRDTVTGKRTVRTYFVTQSLEQLRNGSPLSLKNPPDRAPVFVPGCSSAAEGYPCDWDAFQNVMEHSFDPAFVRP